MSLVFKSRSKKKGLPPGSLVHIGKHPKSPIQLSIIRYSSSECQIVEKSTLEECRALVPENTILWINVDGIYDPEIIRALGEHFRIHPLVLEDIANADQRPKMEDYGTYLYLVSKMLTYHPEKKTIQSEQVSFVLGSNWVLTFQEEKEGDVFEPVRERIKREKGFIRQMGADYLAYSLLDVIVDHYYNSLERIGDEVEGLEEKILDDPQSDHIATLHHLKREVVSIRRSVWPLREVLAGIDRVESDLIQNKTKTYFRDVYDHITQMIDSVETFKEMLSGLLDIYLSSISQKQNAVMKTLTVVSTIFLPLTFLVGVYGMNFEHMPELKWHYGYLLVWGAIAMIVTFMLVLFKRRKWI